MYRDRVRKRVMSADVGTRSNFYTEIALAAGLTPAVQQGSTHQVHVVIVLALVLVLVSQSLPPCLFARRSRNYCVCMRKSSIRSRHSSRRLGTPLSSHRPRIHTRTHPHLHPIFPSASSLRHYNVSHLISLLPHCPSPTTIASVATQADRIGSSSDAGEESNNA